MEIKINDNITIWKKYNPIAESLKIGEYDVNDVDYMAFRMLGINPTKIYICGIPYDAIHPFYAARSRNAEDNYYRFVYIQINYNTGEYYIGKVNRKSYREIQRYNGSGLKFRAKYKKDPTQFVRYFIAVCHSAKESEEIEASIVNEELLKDPFCLNLVRGGGGTSEHPAVGEKIEKQRKYMQDHPEQYQSMLIACKELYTSGDTSHMFGLMSAAADEGFGIFVLLTTDNILLQQQTFKRAERDLSDFCVCDENDYLKFQENNMRKPSVIVLKKNGRVLRQWKNNFSSTQFVAGNPLFIVDDEADAASLNTQVNKNRVSTINKCLDEIKRTTSSSIYLQVTGTPQSILLQSVKSGWKPYFIYYFRPGNGYMGGNFFFTDDEQKHIIMTDNDEATELLADDEFPENGLKTALIMHLISAAHIMLNGGTVCNFIHPAPPPPDYFSHIMGSFVP